MKGTKRIFAGVAAAGAIALALPFAAQAHRGMEGGPGPQAGMQDGQGMHGGMHGGHGGMHGGMQRGMHGDHGHGMPMFLRGLDLSEAQRDAIFRIVHEQAPAMREKGKVARKSAMELRALSMSGQYDEARAAALARASADAMAEMAQMRARSANAIWQQLTPEQRQQVEARRARFEERMHRHGPASDAPVGPRADQPKA